MQLPREVIVGSQVIDQIGNSCKRLGFRRSAFVITGPVAYEVAAKNVMKALAEEGFHVKHLIVHEPSTEYVSKAEKAIQEVKPEFVLGVGGGKDIDIAKLTSSTNALPFISVPTAASHDGIASPYASIRGFDKPYSSKAQAPLAIIADIGIIAKSPYRLLASGCGDIISKYTAVRDWKLAHKMKNEYYGDYAANLALMSARLVIRNASTIRNHSEEGIRTVVEALVSCGVAMSIAGSSRPCSGAEHLFHHALNMVAPKPALHGEQCGVGTVMFAHLHGANWKLIKSMLQKIGAPTTANELKIEPKYIVEALTIAHKIRPDRYTILGETGLTREAAERLAKVTEVID